MRKESPAQVAVKGRHAHRKRPFSLGNLLVGPLPFRVLHHVGILFLIGLFLLPQSGCGRLRRRGSVSYGKQPIRAIWITRWDFKTPNDIARIMENCRAAGFNTVLFQVRGNGTALYRSRLEPWAAELGGHDPGFDPLLVACREGHRRGLSVHAWVNVIPGWQGEKPPQDRRQLYHAHPSWFWYDGAGRRQPLGWYVSLNPCLPEVRRYLVDVMREIVDRYPVDGLHMDYIRFPNEPTDAYRGMPTVPDYPRDRRTLALFKKATGTTPDRSPQVWDQWRTDQVTKLVLDIRKMMLREKPRAILSAAVGAVPDAHKRAHFQDARRWIANGLVDAVYPMNYASDMSTFEQRLAAWCSPRPRVPVIMGIMCDKREGPLVLEQLRRAAAVHRHAAVFAYNALWERSDGSGRLVHDDDSSARAARRQAVIPQLRRFAARSQR